jgi:hypothetical protein
MQLLIQRRQRVGLFGVKFFLATRLELDDEEYRLVTTYHARQAIIFLGDMRRDLFKSFLTAVLATIVLTYVGSYLLWQTVAV